MLTDPAPQDYPDDVELGLEGDPTMDPAMIAKPVLRTLHEGVLVEPEAWKALHDFVYWIANGDPRQSNGERLEGIKRKAHVLLDMIDG